MGFWDSVGGALFGREPKTFDPYAQDRGARMQAMSQGMADYDRMMSSPGAAIPQAYRDQMMKETEQGVRNQYQGAGQSGFLNDRIARAQNDLRMKMLDTELGQLNKQRDYMSQLVSMAQPQQYLPGETGMVQKGASDLMGRSVRELGDVIYGKEQDDKDSVWKSLTKWFGGQGNAYNSTGGFGVGE